jgi:type I restriction enzyme S subunit
VSSGSGTRGGLNLKIISNYKVPIPYPNHDNKSLEKQKEIVAILDKVFKK